MGSYLVPFAGLAFLVFMMAFRALLDRQPGGYGPRAAASWNREWIPSLA